MRKSAKSAPLGSTKVPPAARDRDYTRAPPDRRDRHGFRGVPPPANFSLAELPDDALLTELEVAAVGRWSTNTLAAWRRQPDHPLKWIAIRGGFVRYRAGSVKAYLGAGTPRPRRRKPAPAAPKPDAAPPKRRAHRAKADDVPAMQEQA